MHKTIAFLGCTVPGMTSWVFRATAARTCHQCHVTIAPGQRFTLDDARRPLCLPCHALEAFGLCEEE